MSEHDTGGPRPDLDDRADGAHDRTEGKKNLATGPFSLALDECSAILARIRERVDDHLGVSPSRVSWGHVGDADRLLWHLRRAAFAAGVGEEPLT